MFKLASKTSPSPYTPIEPADKEKGSMRQGENNVKPLSGETDVDVNWNEQKAKVWTRRELNPRPFADAWRCEANIIPLDHTP